MIQIKLGIHHGIFTKLIIPLLSEKKLILIAYRF